MRADLSLPICLLTKVTPKKLMMKMVPAYMRDWLHRKEYDKSNNFIIKIFLKVLHKNKIFQFYLPLGKVISFSDQNYFCKSDTEEIDDENGASLHERLVTPERVR